jgi:hypothetical protein
VLDNCEPEKWHVRFQRVNHQFGRGLQHMPFCARFIGLLDFSYCFVRLCRSDLSTSGFASLLWSTSLPPWLLNLSKLFVCHWCSAAAAGRSGCLAKFDYLFAFSGSTATLGGRSCELSEECDSYARRSRIGSCRGAVRSVPSPLAVQPSSLHCILHRQITTCLPLSFFLKNTLQIRNIQSLRLPPTG